MMKPEDIMRGCEGLVAVWLSVEPRHEEEFNAWYRFEHLDDMIGLEGFYSGRRYASDWLYPKYLALYETDNEKAETGPAFTHMIKHPTSWSARMRTYYGQDRKRDNYKRISLAMRNDSPYGNALLMLHASAAPDKAADVESWYATNATAALEVPGCTAARFYRTVAGARGYLELYDFADSEVLGTSEWYRFLTERRRGVAQHLVDSIQQRYRSLGMERTR
jgi:hypothetical protein